MPNVLTRPNVSTRSGYLKPLSQGPKEGQIVTSCSMAAPPIIGSLANKSRETLNSHRSCHINYSLILISSKDKPQQQPNFKVEKKNKQKTKCVINLATLNPHDCQYTVPTHSFE